MYNWHRKIWVLDQQADDGADYNKILNPTGTNEFWLEPGVYAGPQTTVAAITVEPNSLCYRAQFIGEDMNEAWRGCEFFPAGTEALGFSGKGTPQLLPETERLQANTTLDDGEPAVITLCPDPDDYSKIRVAVELTGGPGGDPGWGGGHNK
jgi:hypothetical protein